MKFSLLILLISLNAFGHAGHSGGHAGGGGGSSGHDAGGGGSSGHDTSGGGSGHDTSGGGSGHDTSGGGSGHDTSGGGSGHDTSGGGSGAATTGYLLNGSGNDSGSGDSSTKPQMGDGDKCLLVDEETEHKIVAFTYDHQLCNDYERYIKDFNANRPSPQVGYQFKLVNGQCTQMTEPVRKGEQTMVNDISAQHKQVDEVFCNDNINVYWAWGFKLNIESMFKTLADIYTKKMKFKHTSELEKYIQAHYRSSENTTAVSTHFLQAMGKMDLASKQDIEEYKSLVNHEWVEYWEQIYLTLITLDNKSKTSKMSYPNKKTSLNFYKSQLSKDMGLSPRDQVQKLSTTPSLVPSVSLE